MSPAGPLRKENQIETIGFEGTVTSIASRSTVLRATDGREVHIPNTEVLSKPIVVYTATSSRKASFDVTVVFDTDLDATIELLTKAVADVDGVLDNPAPSVQASAIHDNTITLSISYWYPSSKSSGSSATDGAIRAVRKTIVEAGVELARPTLDIEREPDPSPKPADTASNPDADAPDPSNDESQRGPA